MSIRAHKQWAREVKGITNPHIVMPVTAHVAFDKGCEYFGIRITHVPVNPKTRQADVADMRAVRCSSFNH